MIANMKRIYKKKKYILLLINIVLLMGCNSNNVETETSSSVHESTILSTNESVLDSSEMEKEEVTTDAETEEMSFGESEENKRTDYSSWLYSLIENDGKIDDQVIFENGINEEKDRFAICDINGDSKQELILVCNSGNDKWEDIYQIDEEDNEIIRMETLPCSENNFYYDNGIILAQSGYQSSLSRKFRDYAVYEEVEGTYFFRANVSAWEKEVDSKDFPEDIDVTNQGVVYYIEYPHIQEVDEVPVSQEEYDKWLEAYIGGANQIEVEYHNLCKEKLDEVLREESNIEVKDTQTQESTLDVNISTEDRTDMEWITAYSNFMASDEFLCEEYALVYINEDDIPELIGNKSDSWYQVCTYMSDATVYCEMMPYGTYSREYYFLPYGGNIISTSIGEDGQGLYEEYFIVGEKAVNYNMTIAKIQKQNDSGNAWIYEKDGVEITEEEWNSLSLLDESYTNFAELEFNDKNVDIVEVLVQ